jgi:hypothetical protein
MGHTVMGSAWLSDVVDFASEDMTFDGLEWGNRPASLSNQVLLPSRFIGGQGELYSSTTPPVIDSVESIRKSGASVS